MRHLEAQGGFIAHRLHAEERAERHPYREALGGDERILALDGDAHLARLHDPKRVGIRIHHGLGFLAGRHLDVIGMNGVVADQRLVPAFLLGMRGQDFGQLPARPVRRDPGRQWHRLGRPDILIVRRARRSPLGSGARRSGGSRILGRDRT